ncbi:Crp/Fnr family transcriptional regulator [Rhodopirellula sp. SWK7]|uniref:Crp/Fnr family transcriptional regulator n=1 Tax=Rhodopirellula sp. SWK7 TaxID=595460 RepID=UPI0002BEF63A|nr:Crp/Fnr family transcriptional regulator [Rhodopirellula sp. SWK7]EMI45639.1 transcriptional regulator, Crp/Fnr family [Rhodopirellula sp. SWK7]
MSLQLWYLKDNELFNQLHPEQLTQLEACCRSRTFAARSPVYLPSETADSVFLLVAGLVKVCNLTHDGKQSILAFIEPGEVFGELAIFDGDERDEYVEAVEDSTVIVIPACELQRMMIASHDLSMAMTKMIGMRRHRMERRLKNLLFLSNRDRLIHLLLDLSEQFGVDDSEGVRIRIKLAHQEIANLMGSTRENVTILLGHLKAEGVINVERRQIALTDPERLAASVNRKIVLRVA